ncbi:hypothetical protein SASPL_152626 [Salvia splendens]|uniref:Uncharacterized protein n=1 Tax=Salvia splendens TaxID=180675 RepID=A0A8X8W3Q7_SALSN|nr:hypothetical protein SASPL_152626 [Salvia splendens]
MAERRHGGRLGDARGGGRGGGRGDLQNKEAARQRDLRDIENDDLRQQVRDLQCDIENGDLRRQVRHLQPRLARLEKRRGKSNPMRSIMLERRSMNDPLFSDVFTSYDADEPSKNMYDEPVYDEDICSMSVYDKPVHDEDILSMSEYDKLIYDEDIFSELPGLMSKSLPPSVKCDVAAEDQGVAVDDDEDKIEKEEGKLSPTGDFEDNFSLYPDASLQILQEKNHVNVGMQGQPTSHDEICVDTGGEHGKLKIIADVSSKEKDIAGTDVVCQMEAYQTLSTILENYSSFSSTKFDVVIDLLAYGKREDGVAAGCTNDNV